MKHVFSILLFFCWQQSIAQLDTAQSIATITIWKDSAIGAIYNQATQTVAYGKANKKGVYKIYLSDTLGKNETVLTYSGWAEDRQQWAEEWHPSGDYLFCYIEKEEYIKEKRHKRKPVDATPGYGAYTDLWLLKRDGSMAWELRDLPNNFNSGLIHGAISDDGTLFAWSERIKAPKYLDPNLMAGSYVLKVANFTVDSVPKLTNIQTFQPGNIDACNELDGFSKDNSSLSFYSTFETKNLFATPIYTLNLSSGEITKLTTASFAQAATYTPDGKHLVYMTGDQCQIFPLEIQGADWWIMDTDGSNKTRISFMNVKNHPHSVNHYRLAGCISFISSNSFFGGVMTKPLGLVGHTVKVTYPY